MGRKKLAPEAQTSVVVLRLKEQLIAEAEAHIGPGEGLQDFIRQAVEAELAHRKHEALYREASRALEIYRGLMKLAQERRAGILAERAGELERMRDDVLKAFETLQAEPAEPSIEELFA